MILFCWHCWHEIKRKAYWRKHNKFPPERTMMDIVTYECHKCNKIKRVNEWLLEGHVRKPLKPRPPHWGNIND